MTEYEAQNAAKAARLKAQAIKGGLRFDVHLPPGLAMWLLTEIEKGTFVDPQEAALAIFSEAQDLPQNPLNEEIFTQSAERMGKVLPMPAVWTKSQAAI